MKNPWFKKWGILYIPVSIAGWLTLVALAILGVFWFIDIDRQSHSLSNTLIKFSIRLLEIGILYLLIGYVSADNRQQEP